MGAASDDWDAAEVPVLEMQIAYVESLCRVGAKLGATVVRVFTAYEAPGQSPHAAWQRTVTALREVCDRAAAHDLTVAVQNHHDVAVHTAALLELLHDVDRPNCKLGFDAWSPARRVHDPQQAPAVGRHAARPSSGQPDSPGQHVLASVERFAPLRARNDAQDALAS